MMNRAILLLLLYLGACGQEVQKYLVVRPEGGLANRLRVLASASVMAKATNRTLILDWRVDSLNMGAKFSDLFQNKIPSPAEIGASDACHQKFERSKDSIEDVYGDFANIPVDSSQVVCVRTCFNFFPKTLSFEEFIGDYKLFYSSLLPVKAIELKIAERQRLFKRQEDMIGVHYRAWKTSTDVKYVFLIPPPLDTFKAEMQQRMSPKDHAFFASDDPEAKKFFDAIFAQILFSDNSNMQRDTVEAQQGAVVDWFLLTKTNAVIGTYQSSFSDEAALMTLTGKKYNVGPKHYDFTSVICFGKDGLPFKRPPGQKTDC